MELQKKLFSFLGAFVALLIGAESADAQRNTWKSQDVGFYVGLNAPMTGNGGAGTMYGVSYAHFYNSGAGFRTGLQYTSEISYIEDSFCFPIAFAYRTPDRSTRDRLNSAAYGAAYSMVRDPYQTPGGLLSDFLINLFSQAEVNVGITPGFVAGENHGGFMEGGSSREWTEKQSTLYFSLDAGAGFNFRLWCFDLKIMPAFHYLLTNNYVECSEIYYGSKTEEPLRWFFSLKTGIAFKF